MASMFYWFRKKQIMEIPLFTPLSPFDCTADRHLYFFFYVSTKKLWEEFCSINTNTAILICHISKWSEPKCFIKHAVLRERKPIRVFSFQKNKKKNKILWPLCKTPTRKRRTFTSSLSLQGLEGSRSNIPLKPSHTDRMQDGIYRIALHDLTCWTLQYIPPPVPPSHQAEHTL